MRAEGSISPRITGISLSVLALGLLAFSTPVLAQESDAQDRVTTNNDELEAVTPDEVRGQADRIRSLFEAAGRNGLVSLKDREGSSGQVGSPGTTTSAEDVADCMTLSPLFDGGQGSFATGHFVELATDRPETAALARTLSDLIDPGYDGRPVEVDLTQASDCGPSFLPWQVLSTPETVLDARTEAALTGSIAKLDENLQRLIGLRIATRAGLSGNTRLMRRVVDTLIDSDLHGQAHHDRDPEHVLLDAMLMASSNPVSARARLSWLAERDGPEQLIAIDLLREIDAAPVAQSELKRLSVSPDPYISHEAQHRLLAHAVEDADIAQLAQMVTVSNNLTDDEQSRARLSQRLSEMVDGDDVLKAIQALDVIDRMSSNGMQFPEALNEKLKARIAQLSSEMMAEAPTPQTVSLPEASSPQTLNGQGLSDYLGDLSEEMTTYQEVLNRG